MQPSKQHHWPSKLWNKPKTHNLFKPTTNSNPRPIQTHGSRKPMIHDPWWAKPTHDPRRAKPKNDPRPPLPSSLHHTNPSRNHSTYTKSICNPYHHHHHKTHKPTTTQTHNTNPKRRENEEERSGGKSEKREKMGRENKILNFKFITYEHWVVYVETYCSRIV